jgi:deazaflavin-dependent oxidoreductase (nitroreductase family)
MSSEFTDNVIAEFRANDGHVGGELAGTPIILMHHIGARTRTERVTPLAFSSQADGRLVIAASNGGSSTHPDWYHNLKAHPTIKVELGAEMFTALAEEVTCTAHAELWARTRRLLAGVGRVPGQDGATHPALHTDATRVLSSASSRNRALGDHKSQRPGPVPVIRRPRSGLPGSSALRRGLR